MSGPLLAASGLVKTYPARGLGVRGRPVRAVDGVSLALERGGTLAVVGESGSGKSTLARLLLGLERPDAGSVVFDGVPVTAARGAALRGLRRRLQAVFQDPFESLDPRLSVATIVAEPLMGSQRGGRDGLRRRVAELLETVGLPAAVMDRRPAAFSGGERQRIAIARALATGPDLLLLDEPLTALDVSVQAQILNLLAGLHRRLGLALVFISHDLTVVRYLCERTAVMLGGRIVEEGPTAVILSAPAHPYTAGLLGKAGMVPGAGEPWPDGACRFAPRCPLADAACGAEPDLEPCGPGHLAACHHPGEAGIS